MPTPTEAAVSAGSAALAAGRRAGPLVLLGVALIAALALLGYERFHGEAQADKILDRWTGTQQAEYAATIAAEFREREARLRLLEKSATVTSEAIDGIRREQMRQGGQIDRVLERLPPR